MRRAFAIAGFALSATALGACGGGDNNVPLQSYSVPVTTQALTKTDFITKADAICAEANSALGSLPSADAATIAGQEADITQNVVDQINALGAPSEDASTLQQYLDAENEVLDNYKKVQLAQARNDTTTLSTLNQAIDAAKARAEASATAYGFQECSKGATAPPPTTGGTAPTTTPTTTTPTTAPTKPPSTGNSNGGASGGVGPG
jgi:hypothetical protein